MYYTRSSKKLDTVSTLNSKVEKVTSSKNDEANKNNFSISGRAVLRSKNISNRKPLNKSGKNAQIPINEGNKLVTDCKTSSLCLQKSKHKVDKNKKAMPTIIDKENILNPNILGIFESNYKTSFVQVTTEQVAEQAVLNKRRKNKKANVDTGSLITKWTEIKSKSDQNKSSSVISDKENTDTFEKSLNLNKSVISKHNPVWKMCPNDNQKSKKRAIDVYDITEDEDLKKEGFNKKKKVVKQNISKAKKFHRKTKKNITKQSGQIKVFNLETNALSNKDEEKLLNNTTALLCSNVKNINNSLGKITSQKEDLQFKNEERVTETQGEVTIICLQKQISTKIAPVRELKLESKDTSNKVTAIDPDKQIHRAITPVKESQPDSKQISNEATVMDPNKQIYREVTPVKKIQPNSNPTLPILDIQDFDTREKMLIPPMTSTPENDVFSSTTPYVTLGNSFLARMSEIPAIPVIKNNVEADGLDDELLYSDKLTCSPVKINLFESPIKMDKLIEKQTSVNLKQMTLNAYVEQYSKTSTENAIEHDKRPEKDSVTHSFHLFDSPIKKRKKPRKSYDNRDKIRVNIACWKKTCKEKSVSEIKEEELVKSLNEHFSDLENFELCID